MLYLISIHLFLYLSLLYVYLIICIIFKYIHPHNIVNELIKINIYTCSNKLRTVILIPYGCRRIAMINICFILYVIKIIYTFIYTT